MDSLPEKIKDVDLSNVMKTSFLDYSMSVLVSRALPDVRDGLKPVHRRILYGMSELGLTPDKPYKKSARIVGEVMGKFHPHGDSAIYESMVRMAQQFSYRYMLVDGHGNFGSIDGDSAAAMRYTEARMSKIATEMLRDINKATIDFQPNYDGTEREPEVLPARFPNLIVNGATGIAVGMTTNIPPHNLSEVISALHILMKNPNVEVTDLMDVLPGPDFPTGGIIVGKSGIKRAYETGKGSAIIRAKVNIEEYKKGKFQIIIHELPYMVNKARLIERISELARNKEIDGITAIHDESDRDGLRITIDIRRDVDPSIILNNLYKMTLMQTSFNFNMLAIVDGIPKILNLKEILQYYLQHQVNVIRRRTEYDLNKAKSKAHILEGLRIALNHVQEIINIVRNSKNGEIAKNNLISQFNLSNRQAQAILDMRLVRLTNLERNKVDNDYYKTIDAINDYQNILSSNSRINDIIYQELLDIQSKYGDKRRTKLVEDEITNIEDEDLIEEKPIAITLTNNGYIKRLPINYFKSQKRGGRGIQGMSVHNDDYIKHILTASTHDRLLFFTNLGKVYSIKGYEIPEYGRLAKGLPIINLLNLNSKEKIATIISTPTNDQNINGNLNQFLFFVTKNGIVKRTSINQFRNIRKKGIKAIHLRDNDELIKVIFTNGNQNMIIGTHLGYASSFNESEIRSMGRNASGVFGIRLRDNDYVIGADILNKNDDVFIITENGYGKRTNSTEYPIKNRGGKGVKTSKITKKNGLLVSLNVISGNEDIMVMTNKGVLIRFNISDVPTTGRLTLGVRLINLDDDSIVSTADRLNNDIVD